MLKLLQGAIIRCTEVQGDHVVFARVMNTEENQLTAQFIEESAKLFEPQVKVLSFNGDTWISLFANFQQITDTKFTLSPIGPIRFRDIDLQLKTCTFQSEHVLTTLQSETNLQMIGVSRNAAAFETSDVVAKGTTGHITISVADNSFNVEATVVQQLFTDETSYLLCEIRNLTRLAQASWETLAISV